MFKKILATFLYITFIVVTSYAQSITVTNISATGHFDPVNPVGGGCGILPTITATYLNGVGTTLNAGTIVCNDPCGNTTVHIVMSNVRWSKTSTINWLHGISFTPGNVTVTNVALPAGWFPFTSSTGAGCGGGAPVTTGVGFYFDGTTGNSCCPTNTLNDGIPGNNYGDVVADCGFAYSFSFDLTFCNTSITTNPLAFSARGTSDYQTGCWSVVDPIGTSKIQFVLATQACTNPLFTANPTATIPVKTCVGGVTSYTTTLSAGCGNGFTTTWWNAATGGTQLGTGTTFNYTPAGGVCPAGLTIFASCCPTGTTCATRRAVGVPGTCPAALAITGATLTHPTCVSPTGSIDAVTVTGAAPGPILYTLNPGGFSNNTGIFTGLTLLNYTLSVQDETGCTATFPIAFTPSGTGGPLPFVTSPLTYCQNQIGIAALSATALPGGTLTWYLPNGTNVGAVAPTPSTLVSGTFTYTVTQTIGTCTSAPASIIVNITAAPAAPGVTTPINYCQGATTSQLTATGTNLTWYVSATAPTGTSVAPTPSSASAGSTTYWVGSNTGTCFSTRSFITVNINATPALIVTNPAAVCMPNTVDITAAAITSGSTAGLILTYWTNATATTSYTTPTVATAGTYYIKGTTAAGCFTITPVVVTVNPLLTPVITCGTATASTVGFSWVSVAGATGYNVSYQINANPVVNIGAIGNVLTYTVNGLSGGNNVTITVTPTGTGCFAAATKLCVAAGCTPTTATIGYATPFCVTTTTAQSVTLTGTGLFTGGTYSSTSGLTINPTTGAITPNTSTVGTYVVTYTIAATPGCPATTTTTTVVIAPLTVPTFTAIAPICSGNTLTALPTSSTNGVIGTWSPALNNTTTTTYLFTPTIGQCATTATLTITVNLRPAAPVVTTPINYCQNATSVALTATGTNLLWYTTPTAIGTATAIVPATSVVGSTTYYVSQSALTCEGAKSAIVVNIAPVLTVNAGNGVIIARGNQTQLLGTASVGANYLWTSNISPLALSSATILNPIANPLATTTYTLTVSDPTSLCPSVSHSVIVTVVQSCINVRNAFSPNGDGINDTWLVYDNNFCLAKDGAFVSVFNRYGSKVFEAKGYTNNWNGTYKGKALPDGTYFAVIEFIMQNGTKQFVKSDLTILR
ncbi:MAG: gliding motility-associated C-terminal domain-containing protein [Lysobacteraceae bacterium]|nr:gliding motility-associated C-terminal domain-containing protein [Ferruginibacter sp.]